MKIYTLLIFIFALLTCSSPTDPDNVDNNCEVVINAQGPGFLKVVNNLSSTVEVFLPEYAFAARLRANTCEIYGLNTGLRQAEISICIDSECNTYSDSKNITFLIEDGETYTLVVNQAFFKKG